MFDDDRTKRARKMEDLALNFHALRDKAGTSPWNADVVDRWAASGGPSHGERVTAQFLLAVWNPNHEWTSGRFDVMEALRIWDERHRGVFLSWARDPWWV